MVRHPQQGATLALCLIYSEMIATRKLSSAAYNVTNWDSRNQMISGNEFGS